jgi:polysaccharide biosynthesis protein PslH
MRTPSGCVMQILFLSGHLPSPRARQAGQKTSYRVCEFLARRHGVHLLSFATKAELSGFRREDMSLYGSFDLVPVSNRTRMIGLATGPSLPLVAAVRHSAVFRRKLKSLLRKQTFDAAYLDFTGMMQYQVELANIPVVAAMEVEVMFRRWESRRKHSGNQFVRSLFGWEERRTKRWEIEQLKRVDVALVQSSEEKQLLAELLPGQEVRMIRPWIELGDNSNVLPHTEREQNSLVFWGAMDRIENIDAVSYATEGVLPAVWTQFADARYYIAGSNPSSALIRRYANSRVIVSGFVDRPFEFLATKRVALLPMRLGAGIKVKVLECMAAGLAVVTTPAGAEGVPGCPGKHYLLGSDARQLAEAALKLLRSPSYAAEMGHRARISVCGNHQFTESLRALEDEVLQRLEHVSNHTRLFGIEVHA